MPRKLTHELFLERVKLKHNEIITVLGHYVKNNVKIECLCNKCGLIWEITPANLMNGQGCPKCNSKQKTHEQFCNEIEDKYKGKIVVLENYKNAYTKIQFKCNECESVFLSTPSNLLQAGDIGCKKCVGIIQSKQFAKTQEQFENELRDMSPHITILSEYKNLRTKVKCRCDKGHEWETTGQILLSGSNCPVCNIKSKMKTHEEFINEIRKIHGNNITILSEYKGGQRKVKCKCNIDGYEWESLSGNLLAGKGCSVCCSNTCIKGINDINTTHPELTKYFKNVEDSYVFTKGSDRRTTFKCDKCGYEKDMQVKNIVNFGFSCDLCSDGVSIPNKFTANILKQLNVSFETEKTFDWAKNKRYDIYIENYNGKNIVIENHGLQHYEGGFVKDKKKELAKIQKNDKVKKQLALLNGIDIYIEIPFNNRINTLTACKKSIYNSQTNNLFDLSSVNWNEVWEKCVTGLKYQTWELWNTMDKELRSEKYISNLLGLNKHTIHRYIKEGECLGKVKG